jgi:hypothetical protein
MCRDGPGRPPLPAVAGGISAGQRGRRRGQNPSKIVSPKIVFFARFVTRGTFLDNKNFGLGFGRTLQFFRKSRFFGRKMPPKRDRPYWRYGLIFVFDPSPKVLAALGQPYNCLGLPQKLGPAPSPYGRYGPPNLVNRKPPVFSSRYQVRKFAKNRGGMVPAPYPTRG